MPDDQAAIKAFTVLVGLAPFAVMVWVWTGRSWVWFAIPAIWIMKGMVIRIYPRPELFTALGMAILLVALDRFPGRLSWAWVMGFLVLFSLWANLHGGVVLAIPFLAAILVCDAIQDRDRKRTEALGFLFLAAVAAIQLNPYGFNYWRAFRPINSYVFSNLREWKPLWEVNLPDEVLIGAGLAGAIALAVWTLSPNRRLSHLICVLLAAGLFVHAVRNISLLIVVSGIVTALNAKALEPDRIRSLQVRGRQVSTSTRVLLLLLLHAGFLSILALEFAALLLRQDLTIPIERYRDGSIAFLRNHRLQGRAFCDMENSGYFHWYLRDSLPLFIDNVNAYQDQIMRDYFTIIQGGRAAHVLIDKYDINVIILTVQRIRSLARLAENLDHAPEWARVDASDEAVVWVRRRDFSALIEAIGPVRPTSFHTLEFMVVEHVQN